MKRALLVVVALSACGRSELTQPPSDLPGSVEQIGPAPESVQAYTASPLIGHWADFRIGNCINDEAWLSFGPGAELTVTSVNRNYCGPHSIAVARGTYAEGAETLKLQWAPTAGPRALESTYAVLPAPKFQDPYPQGYTFGEREISLRVWAGSGPFTRRWIERNEEMGKVYARKTEASVSFDAPLLGSAEGSIVTASLHWTSTVEWGADPARSLDEAFTLPCRVTVENGVRHVKAVVLDQYDGFWKLLVSRGLDKSYGWDLDRVIYTVGPNWIVDSTGRLMQSQSTDSPVYFELKHPPPTTP